MKTTLWVLTLILVVVMSTQWGVHVGGETKTITRLAKGSAGAGPPVERTDIKREGGAHVTPGDVLLLVTFLIWAVYVVVTVKIVQVRVPFLAVFVFLAIVLASVIRSRAWGPGLRELVQLGGYLVGGWLVFANCINTRRRLKAAVEVFAIVVGLIIIVALCQYRAAANGNVFEVAGTFGNRNVLGVFLAMALPFVFALALYEKGVWQRFSLALVVAVGAMVTLSGGALIAMAVALLFVAALKSQKALLGVLVALALAVTVVPGTLSLPRHSDVVISSVAPYIYSNFLDRSEGDPEPQELAPAVRYKRWYAATWLIQRTLRRSVLGVGPGRFNDEVRGPFAYVHTSRADTDSVPDFNISVAEPDTFNMYLVTCAEAGPLGLIALVWIGVWLLARNVRNHYRCRDDFGKALALGSAGAVIGAALCAVFSNILVRGVALPFIFIALSGILWAKLPDEPEPDR